MSNSLWFPEVALHIYMTIGLESNAFGFQQRALATPAGGGAPFFIHDTMTGKLFCPRCVAQCATNHPRVAGPACQGGDMAVGGDAAMGYLTDDV